MSTSDSRQSSVLSMVVATRAHAEWAEWARKAAEREAHLLHALAALVRAHDHPPDGTGFARDRAAIVEARKLLGEAPVIGVDGKPA